MESSLSRILKLAWVYFHPLCWIAKGFIWSNNSRLSTIGYFRDDFIPSIFSAAPSPFLCQHFYSGLVIFLLSLFYSPFLSHHPDGPQGVCVCLCLSLLLPFPLWSPWFSTAVVVNGPNVCVPFMAAPWWTLGFLSGLC